MIRESAIPGAIPQQENHSATSAGYTCIMDKLIAYAPHDGAGFAEDNAAVLQILSDLTADTQHASSIKTFTRARDVRGAYFALVQHNMGLDKMIEAAEALVLTRVWNGKNSRYSLKRHINNHREAVNMHTI